MTEPKPVYRLDEANTWPKPHQGPCFIRRYLVQGCYTCSEHGSRIAVWVGHGSPEGEWAIATFACGCTEHRPLVHGRSKQEDHEPA